MGDFKIGDKVGLTPAMKRAAIHPEKYLHGTVVGIGSWGTVDVQWNGIGKPITVRSDEITHTLKDPPDDGPMGTGRNTHTCINRKKMQVWSVAGTRRHRGADRRPFSYRHLENRNSNPQTSGNLPQTKKPHPG